MGRMQRKGVLNNKRKLNKTKPAEKTRKQLRKEKRVQKKLNKAAYYEKKKSTNQPEKSFKKSEQSAIGNDKSIKGGKIDVKDELSTKAEKRKIKDIENKEKRAEKNVKKQRVQQLQQANKEEDKMIKQLEKRLKLNKRKSKSIPQSFVADGLDYILDFCNSENRNVETEKQLLESGLSTEFKEDLNIAIGENDSEEEHEKDDTEYNMDDNEDSEQDTEDNKSLLSNENSDHHEDNDEVSEEEADKVNIKSRNRPTNKEDAILETEESIHSDASEHSHDSKGLWEDIYGRQRDKEGNIVSTKYVPPAARITSTDISMDDEKTRKLERQLKGILNRLAEQNMHTIANQVEEMYMSNSRNSMNVTLFTLMMESIVAQVLTPDRLICEHMMLIAILHANVGTEVGAHFLLTTVKKLHRMLDESHCVENKQLDNIILMISHLYNFKVYGHRLLYQILKKLAAKFTEKEIELTLLILRTVGFQLRKDDPTALKELVLNLQQKANNTTLENSRVKFMLDVLLAIKNNNMSKIPQYDPSQIEHLKKILKNFIHKGNSVTQFNVTLEDLLEADERGKWWIVGSAWSGLKDIGKLEKSSGEQKQKYSAEILELARKQRMNTDIRRDIFCVLMTAEDYLDAFEKIHHLGLKNQQQREVIYVILNCCIQEKKFNPYYAVLAQRLCDCDRKYQVIQFTELDKLTMRLVRQIMLGILLHEDEGACLEVFERISLSTKLQAFKESLRLFINHFLVKNISTAENLQEQSALLKKRAELIDNILSRQNRETKCIF
ncbi:nucleolar MIF4G domain-containing protein 1 homolog isoform X2 [Ooceraea biroi]|uniref:nucleolar MIF4G domain-containing protein 1 homolog isoform X2 n=1 Tax=Ooceraea biroi TaxID=2015173 RepID=UPI000F07684D|nr:nucleolar MIF4G domain-containing protein 1 homolog isoform X2 [Ooceraea biroi]